MDKPALSKLQQEDLASVMVRSLCTIPPGQALADVRVLIERCLRLAPLVPYHAAKLGEALERARRHYEAPSAVAAWQQRWDVVYARPQSLRRARALDALEAHHPERERRQWREHWNDTWVQRWERVKEERRKMQRR